MLAAALGISVDAATPLAAHATRRRFPAKSFLCLEGDSSTHVYLIEVGLLRVDRVTAGGRSVLLELATPGDLVGELGVVDDSPRSATVSTVTESRLVTIGAEQFRAAMADSIELTTAVLHRVVERMRALSDQLVEVSAHSAAGRVAARLLILIEHAGAAAAPFDLRLPINQEELGQWAGLSREGVVKALAELRSLGAIETGRRRVTVLDTDTLRRIAATA